MPVGQILEMDNIALLDFDWENGTIQATVFTRGTLDTAKVEIAADDMFLDDIDYANKSFGNPIIGYVVNEGGRDFFYSIHYEHGEML